MSGNETISLSQFAPGSNVVSSSGGGGGAVDILNEGGDCEWGGINIFC